MAKYPTKQKFGNKNPNWKGGVMFDKKRKLILSPNHPNPDFLKKYCYEYRLKMEKKLGRFLKKNEIVHHKNGDVTDNRLCNLQVMTQSQHARLHWKDNPPKNRSKTHKILKRDSNGRFVKKNG